MSRWWHDTPLNRIYAPYHVGVRRPAHTLQRTNQCQAQCWAASMEDGGLNVGQRIEADVGEQSPSLADVATGQCHKRQVQRHARGLGQAHSTCARLCHNQALWFGGSRCIATVWPLLQAPPQLEKDLGLHGTVVVQRVSQHLAFVLRKIRERCSGGKRQ